MPAAGVPLLVSIQGNPDRITIPPTATAGAATLFLPRYSKEDAMRRLILALLVLGISLIVTDRATCAPPITGTFTPSAGSTISGKVSVHPTKDGGSKITVRVDGLTTDVEYIAVWSTSSTCDVGTAPPLPTSVIGRFRGDKKGSADVTATTSASPGQIRSVAIQLGNGLTVVACSTLQ
jgi:hypothetical protein